MNLGVDVALIGGVLWVATSLRSRRKRLEALRASAGLTPISKSLFRGDRIAGFQDGLLVELRAFGGFVAHPFVEVRIDLRGLVPEGISILPSEQAGEGRWVRSGDPAFDSAYGVEGSEVETLARLTSAVRKCLIDLGELQLVHSELQLVFALDALAESRLAKLIAASRDLSLVESTPLDRLLARVREDPAIGARLRALEVMTARFPNTPEAQEAAAHALESDDDALKLTAAMFLGGERGDPIILTAAKSGSAFLRSRALRHLGRTASWEVAAPLIEDGMGSDEFVIFSAATFALALQAGATPARLEKDEVRRRLEASAEPQTPKALAVVEALTMVGAAESEDYWVRALASGANGTRIAAATALGRFGSPRCIPMLVESSKSNDSSLAKAASRSLGQVRRRHGHLGEGGLSMVQDDRGGELEVVEDGGLEVVETSEHSSRD